MLKWISSYRDFIPRGQLRWEVIEHWLHPLQVTAQNSGHRNGTGHEDEILAAWPE